MRIVVSTLEGVLKEVRGCWWMGSNEGVNGGSEGERGVIGWE